MAGLADPTRLRLLRLLERHELGVAELCDILQTPQSTISRHLKVLGDLGWSASRSQGTANLYRMSPDQLDPAALKLWLLARDQTEHWATTRQDELRLQERLSRRKSAARQFFAETASHWDQLSSELYGQGFVIHLLAAMTSDTWTVADLGCGTGMLAAALAPWAAHVIAVDQSPEMLAAAGDRTRNHTNVQLRQGELEALPIDNDACDLALASLVLSYVAEPAAVAAEARRILKPGGRLIVLDVLRHDDDDFRMRMGQHRLGFDIDDLQLLLTDAGLAPIDIREVPPAPEATGPALIVAAARHTHA